MKSRIWILAVMTVFTALVAVPAHAHGTQAAPANQHADHHTGQADAPATATVPAPPANMMASMTASNAKLDALVKKMNAAKGSAKTDAIAELLTAIVQEHHAMQESMMTNMSSHIRVSGRVLGLELSLDEVVTEREPPTRKVWETVGSPRLLVIVNDAVRQSASTTKPKPTVAE